MSHGSDLTSSCPNLCYVHRPHWDWYSLQVFFSWWGWCVEADKLSSHIPSLILKCQRSWLTQAALRRTTSVAIASLQNGWKSRKCWLETKEKWNFHESLLSSYSSSHDWIQTKQGSLDDHWITSCKVSIIHFRIVRASYVETLKSCSAYATFRCIHHTTSLVLF